MTGQSRALTRPRITAYPARTLLMLAMMALVVGVLSGCAPRGYFNAFSPQTAPLATQPVFVATQRDGPSLLALTGDRTRDLRYGRIDVSIPAEHEIGQIEWARDGAGFGVAGAWSYPTSAGFQHAIRTQVRAQDDVIVVFVPICHCFFARLTKMNKIMLEMLWVISKTCSFIKALVLLPFGVNIFFQGNDVRKTN